MKKWKNVAILFGILILCGVLIWIYLNIKETKAQQSIINELKEPVNQKFLTKTENGTLENYLASIDNSSLVNKVPLVGRALIWDFQTNLRSKANSNLSGLFKAKSSDKSITVFMILCHRNGKNSTNSDSNQPTFIQYIDLGVSVWPEKKFIGLYSIECKVNGASQNQLIVEWIKSLKKFENYSEAKDCIDDLQWQEVSAINKVQQFEQFIQIHPDSKYIQDAKNSIENLHWQEAMKTNTVKAYREFLSVHPQGRFEKEADKKIANLQNDDSLYDSAFKIATEDSFKQFLTDYPGHRKEKNAQLAVEEITVGRDLFELLAEKKIEVQAFGVNVDRVDVKVRKTVPYSIIVFISVGSYFVCEQDSYCDMICVKESRVELTNTEWINTTVTSACANISYKIPKSGTTFTISKSTHLNELIQIMPVLEESKAELAIKQAAVWIVIINASFYELTLLIDIDANNNYLRNTISHSDAAYAMMICEKAGINIATKRIWYDRYSIYNQIVNDKGEDELKKWMKSKL